jgi:hypothetical protein
MRQVAAIALATVLALPVAAQAQDWNRALDALTGRDTQTRVRDDDARMQDEIERIRDARADIRQERREIARERGVRFIDYERDTRRYGSSGSSAPLYRQLEDERAALARDRRHLEDERNKLENERGRSRPDTLGARIDELLGNRR